MWIYSLEIAKDRLLAEMAKGITPTKAAEWSQNRAVSCRDVYGNGNITGDAVRAAVMAAQAMKKRRRIAVQLYDPA